MNEQKKKEVKLSYEEQLVKKIEDLEKSSKELEYQFHQIQGALNFAKMTLDEYRNSTKDIEDEK